MSRSREERRAAARQRAQKRKERSGGNAFNNPDGAKWFHEKISDDAVRLDILQFRVDTPENPRGDNVGDVWYECTYQVHYGIGAEEKKFICLRTWGKACPICEYVSELRKDDYEKNKKEIKELQAKNRQLFNVIAVDSNPDEVLLWDISIHNFGGILDGVVEKKSLRDDTMWDFHELKGGKTLEVWFEGASIGTGKPFPRATMIELADREDYDEEWLDVTHDLDAMLVQQTYDELNNIFLGITADDSAPEEKPDAAPKRGAPGRGRGAPKREPDPDPDPDPDPPADDGPQECPNGGTFGESTDEIDGCEKCDVWEACKTASQGGEPTQEAPADPEPDTTPSRKAPGRGKPARGKPAAKSDGNGGGGRPRRGARRPTRPRR